MSVTLAAVADALIEFILSLLRDPDEAKQFDAAPQQVLAAKGLSHVSAQDVCAVAPIIADRPDVVVHVTPVTSAGPRPFSAATNDPVVREVRNIINNLYSIDDRDTIIDQSVNQNIWAQGDVTQIFDNEAVAATGDNSIAAGNDVGIHQTQDDSTTITAGHDVNMGNDTTSTTTGGSNNQTTDASTTTDTTTTTTTSGSFDDSSTTAQLTDSGDTTATSTDHTTVDSTTNEISDSTDSSITQFTDPGVDVDESSAFSPDDTLDDSAADDGL